MPNGAVMAQGVAQALLYFCLVQERAGAAVLLHALIELVSQRLCAVLDHIGHHAPYLAVGDLKHTLPCPHCLGLHGHPQVEAVAAAVEARGLRPRIVGEQAEQHLRAKFDECSLAGEGLLIGLLGGRDGRRLLVSQAQAAGCVVVIDLLAVLRLAPANASI